MQVGQGGAAPAMGAPGWQQSDSHLSPPPAEPCCWSLCCCCEGLGLPCSATHVSAHIRAEWWFWVLCCWCEGLGLPCRT